MTHAERHCASVLNEAWGIDAVLQPLPGEFDVNFLATARDRPRCVLKVVREGCDAAFVSLLCAAHAHVRSRDATVTVPAVVPTTAGESWCVRHGADVTNMREPAVVLSRDCP
jgi:Ser/Thr protein kinase RdoA (MazF antagonist)